jgi:hypothetical protein
VSTLLRLLLPLLGGLVGRALASLFSGSCPLSPTAGPCLHWDALASVAGVILGALGYRVTRPKLAASKAGLRIDVPLKPKPPPAPEPEPATSGEIVIPTRDPSEIDWDKRDG